MSIIYDALKKTQGIIEKNQENPSVPHLPNSRQHIRLIIFIIFIIIGFAFANFIFLVLNKPKKQIALTPPLTLSFSPNATQKPLTAPTTSPSPPESQSAPPQKVKEDIPTPEEKKPMPELTLNGLFCAGRDSWVMINNQILKKGDSVEGAKVVDILPTEVILEFEGEKINLQLK